MIRKPAVVAAFLFMLSSCLLNNYELVSQLDISSNWYCNIWGTPVITGSIINNATTDVSAVKVSAKIIYYDGENYKQTLTINDDIPAGGRIEFKKWLTNPRDEHPRTITVTIVDAW